MWALRPVTGIKVHGYPPAAIMRFIRKRPMRPLPSM